MKVCVRCKERPRTKKIWICSICCVGLIENPTEYTGEHYVYGLYKGGKNTRRLVYIGVTSNPLRRAGEHFSSKTKSFKSMRIINSFAERSEAEDFERKAIHLLTPRFNILVLEVGDLNGKFSESDIVDIFGTVQDGRRRKPIIRKVPTGAIRL